MNLRVMRVIAAITDAERNTGKSAQSGVAPALRLAVSILAILLCALSRNAFFVLCVIAVELLRTALLPADSVRRIMEKLPAPVLMTALLMLPAVFLGSPRSMGTVTMKVLNAVLILAILNEKVSWREMTGALAACHAPEIFILTLDTAVRFFVLLGRYSNRLLEAVSLRRVGEKTWRNAGTGGILGTTWLKSQKMAAANAEAMACRCFDGVYRKNSFPKRETERERRKRFAADLLYACLIPALVLCFFYTQAMV